MDVICVTLIIEHPEFQDKVQESTGKWKPTKAKLFLKVNQRQKIKLFISNPKPKTRAVEPQSESEEICIGVRVEVYESISDSNFSFLNK